MHKFFYFFFGLGLFCFFINPSYCRVDKGLEAEIAREYKDFENYRIPELTTQPCKAVLFVHSLQKQFQQNPDKRTAEKIAAIISEGAGVGGIDTERQATEDEKIVLLGAISLSTANKIILTDPMEDNSVKPKSLAHQQYVYDVYRAINNLKLNLTDYNFLDNKGTYKNFVQRIEDFFKSEKDKKNTVKQNNSNDWNTIKEKNEAEETAKLYSMGTSKSLSDRITKPKTFSDPDSYQSDSGNLKRSRILSSSSLTPPSTKKNPFSLDEDYVSIYDRMDANLNQRNINKKTDSEEYQEYVRVQELLKVCFLTGKKYEEDYLNIHKNQQELIRILERKGRVFKLTSAPNEWENSLSNQKTFIETAIKSIYKKYDNEQKKKVDQPLHKPMSTYDAGYTHPNYGKGIFG